MTAEWIMLWYRVLVIAAISACTPAPTGADGGSNNNSPGVDASELDGEPKPAAEGSASFGSISTGSDGHVCAVHADGTFECWGENDRKQVTAAPNEKMSIVVAGDQVSCGVLKSGLTKCWPDYPTATTPADPLTSLTLAGLPGSWFACGLKADGSLVCWGTVLPLDGVPTDHLKAVFAGRADVCGIKSSDGSLVCTGAFANAMPAGAFTKVALGSLIACGLRTNGSVVCWGDVVATTPAPSGAGFTEITMGDSHACALRGGDVTCWGENQGGQLAVPTGKYLHISAAANQTCGILMDGSAVCWGALRTPVPPFVRLSADSTRICGIGKDGKVTCSGTSSPDGMFEDVSAAGGQVCGLGIDGSASCWGARNLSTAVAPAGPYTRVVAGVAEMACGLRAGGAITCWGSGAALTSPPSGTFMDLSLSPSALEGVAVRSDGTLAYWGEQVGLNPSVPAGTFTRVSAGSSLACALASDQSIVCWGGGSSAENQPPAGRFTQVSVGDEFACAIDVSGELACWGSNDSGQSTPPMQGTFTQVTASADSPCALDVNQKTHCWGSFVYPPQ